MQHERFASNSRRTLRSVANGKDLAAWSLLAVDCGLAGVVLLAPWFMGGRHPLGQLVLVLCAVLIGTAWPLHQLLNSNVSRWCSCGAEYILLAAIALVVLQLAPLPAEMLQRLSPQTGEILPLWSGGRDAEASLGEWRTLTLTPQWTRGALVMLLAYSMIFIVTVQRIGTVEDVERILRWFVIAAAIMAVVGLLQYIVGNGKFLWIYHHTSRSTDDAVKGPFINKNHFAHLLALMLGPLLWSVQNALHAPQRQTKDAFGTPERVHPLSFWGIRAQFVVLALLLFAGLLTFSRGGTVAMGVAAVVGTALLYWAGLLGRRFLLGLGIALGLTAIALTIHGYQKVTERLDDYAAGSIDELDSSQARRKIWAADWRGAQDYLATGTGVGSHREVYRMYFPDSWTTEFTHAENGYLQVLLEAGVPGLALVLAGIVLCGYWCINGLVRSASKRELACGAAVTAGLMASVVHSAVDFVWYISSCMSFTAILAACACRLSQLTITRTVPSSGHRSPISRYAYAVASLCVLVVGVWMCQNRFCGAMAAKHWDQYLFSKRSVDPETADKTFDKRSIEQLTKLLYWTPNDARAHVRLAKLYQEGFEHLQRANGLNDHPLSMIRDAALANFQSREDLQRWLLKAVGPHVKCLELALWHARRGVELCPLQGEAYVYINSLNFLDQGGRIPEERCLAQAELVRPYHEEVLFALASNALIRNDLQSAFRHWRTLFKKNCGERRQLINMWANSEQPMPVEVILDQLEPDLSALRTVYRCYRSAKAQVDMTALLHKYRDAAEAEALTQDGRLAAARWLEAHQASQGLHDHDRAIHCGERALSADPNNFDAHYTLGKYLLELGRGSDAEVHLRWCSQRRPTDAKVQLALEQAVKSRVGGQFQLSSAPGSKTPRR